MKRVFKAILWIIVGICILGIIGVGFEYMNAQPMNEPVNTAAPTPAETVALPTTIATPAPTIKPTLATAKPTIAPTIGRTWVSEDEPEATPTQEKEKFASLKEDVAVVENSETTEPVGNGQYQHYVQLHNSNKLYRAVGSLEFCSVKNRQNVVFYTKWIFVEIPPGGTIQIAVPGAIDNSKEPIALRICGR